MFGCSWLRRRGAAAGVAFAVAAGASAFVVAQARTAPGSPLAGLTPVEFEDFRLGLDDFLEVEAAEEGLGPAFNATSCAVCHNVPAVGGAGTIAELRAGRRNAQGDFEALDSSGETLFHLFSVPGHACQPVVPADATIFARRVPIALFGAGLVEALPDRTILDLEDPSDRNRDGVSGRAAIVVDVATGERRIGRFGWKAQHATLLAFAADAYRNEMGITNALFPHEVAFGITRSQMQACDRFPDPEDKPDPRTRRRGIDNFANFMRFLAPIVPEASGDAVNAGQQVFAAIGCSACHVASLVTDRSSNPLFDRKTIFPFSDFLLHDVATGDGIRQASAEPDEIRTPALWGLRFRRPLLHDGTAGTIEDAVRRHGNEAELARRGFERLSDIDRAALLTFLRGL
jgi:CxxC motif-containing protein (DUF1111 family)